MDVYSGLGFSNIKTLLSWDFFYLFRGAAFKGDSPVNAAPLT